MLWLALVAKSPNTKKYSFGAQSKNCEHTKNSNNFLYSCDLVAGTGIISNKCFYVNIKIRKFLIFVFTSHGVPAPRITSFRKIMTVPETYPKPARHGDIVFTTDELGEEATAFRYDAFGNVIQASSVQWNNMYSCSTSSVKHQISIQQQRMGFNGTVVLLWIQY